MQSVIYRAARVFSCIKYLYSFVVCEYKTELRVSILPITYIIMTRNAANRLRGSVLGASSEANVVVVTLRIRHTVEFTFSVMILA
jgi:hypothetical protein